MKCKRCGKVELRGRFKELGICAKCSGAEDQEVVQTTVTPERPPEPYHRVQIGVPTTSPRYMMFQTGNGKIYSSNGKEITREDAINRFTERFGILPQYADIDHNVFLVGPLPE